MGKGRKGLDLSYQCWKTGSLYFKQENCNRTVILLTLLGGGEERRQTVKKLCSKCWFKQEGIQGKFIEPWKLLEGTGQIKFVHVK